MTEPCARTVRPHPLPGGVLRVPGDKSISHRCAMLAGLAGGTSVIRGFLCSGDCLNTLSAVAALGAGVERDGTTVTVRGTGGTFRAPAGPLDLGNSGTGLRLLAGLLAGHPFESVLTGDASLSSRPMRRIAEPLSRMGAAVSLTGERGTAPVCIRGARLAGIEYTLPVASAQVKSCVLLAGLFARGRTTVIEPKPTRDHTERALLALGLPLRVQGLAVSLEGASDGAARLPAREWDVPGDFSSAAFWLVAAACRAGSRVRVASVGLNPRRTALLDVLRRMGADVAVAPAAPGAGEAAGDVEVRGARLRGTVIEGDEIPNLIDELPIAAVAAAFAEGETVIRDAAELRVKESDRIAAMVACLRACGVEVEERPDGMRIAGTGRVRGGATIDSAGDHRVAMAMAVLGLLASEPVRVLDTDCIATSYPGFWDAFGRLGAAEAVARDG